MHSVKVPAVTKFEARKREVNLSRIKRIPLITNIACNGVTVYVRSNGIGMINVYYFLENDE